MDNLKKCNACLLEKNLSEFGINNHMKDGYNSKCKDCIKNKNEAKIEYHYKGETKICKCCFKEKDLYWFQFRIKRGYYEKRCRECKKNKVTIQEKKEIDGKLRCEKCNIFKPFDSFHKNKSNKRGVTSWCKKCTNKKQKIFRKNNPEKVRGWKSKDYQKHSDAYKKRAKKYSKNNRQKINKYIKKRNKIKTSTEPLYKLKRNISSLIRNSLKKEGFIKKSKSEEILGCTTEEFKNHIESQFLDWMNWSNHGLCEEGLKNNTWNLDHIVPITAAKNEEEVLMLNHWSNFQPLCSFKNIKKGNILFPCTNLELNKTFENN